VGVESIGFGQSALGASEVPGVAGIDHADRDLGLLQRGHDTAFIATGRLANDVAGGPLLQPTHQRRMRLRSVSETARDRVWLIQRTHIEMGFGNIQTDMDNRL